MKGLGEWGVLKGLESRVGVEGLEEMVDLGSHLLAHPPLSRLSRLRHRLLPPTPLLQRPVHLLGDPISPGDVLLRERPPAHLTPRESSDTCSTEKPCHSVTLKLADHGIKRYQIM